MWWTRCALIFIANKIISEIDYQLISNKIVRSDRLRMVLAKVYFAMYS